MELEANRNALINPRRIAAGFMMGIVTMLPAVGVEMAHAEPDHSTSVDTQNDKDKDEWKLASLQSFDDNELPPDWQIIGPRDDRGSKYKQYRVSIRNVKVGGGKITIRSERECDGAPSVAPCSEDQETTYTSGRVEGPKNISGDFRLVIKARAPFIKDRKTGKPQRGFRTEMWGKNGDNVCIEDETDYKEFDIAELFNRNFTTSNNIVRCEYGKYISAPRKEEYDEGWADEVHEFAVEREGRRMEFFVDGDPVGLVENPNRSKDRLSDFSEITAQEFDEGYSKSFGLILSNTVFVDYGEGNYQRVNDNKNFIPPRLIVYKIEQYAK